MTKATVFKFAMIATTLAGLSSQAVAGDMTNGVMMKDGKMMMMKDGKSEAMTKEMMMSDGTKVMSDGSVMMKNGEKMQMKDGQIMDMSGKMMDHGKMMDGK